MYTHVHSSTILLYLYTIEVFTIAKLWNQPKYPETNKQIKKIWYIYTMEYYSTIKKNEVMLFTGKLMELEIIMLSKIARLRKISITYSQSYSESSFRNEWHCSTAIKKYIMWKNEWQKYKMRVIWGWELVGGENVKEVGWRRVEMIKVLHTHESKQNNDTY
jgi:hypothetical protein